MTAEVVIMNRNAVAMAADSAVSVVSQQVANASVVKVYNRARKLMKANAAGTIGVMFYESPDFLGLPWEVIVNEFVHDDHDEFPTVEACGDAFLAYLGERCGEWSTQEDTLTATHLLLAPLVRDLLKQWDAATADPTAGATQGASAQRTAARQMVKATIARRAGKLQALTRSDSIGRNATQALKATVREFLTGDLSAFWLKLTDGLRSELIDVACEEIMRIKRSEPNMTGLFFAGFGTTELFPAAVHHLIAGRIDGGLRATKRQSYVLGPKTPMVIAPLAQSELIQTFIDGINPEVTRIVHDLIDELTRGSTSSITDPSSLAAELKDVFEELVAAHRRPVLDAVPFLPPSDLAQLARSLLEFTALRQRVSMRPETVGGPFDVAIISRHSGFTWYEQALVTAGNTPDRR